MGAASPGTVCTDFTGGAELCVEFRERSYGAEYTHLGVPGVTYFEGEGCCAALLRSAVGALVLTVEMLAGTAPHPLGC
jgi:hypothetical protein